jgi:hypothetical protein
MLKFLKFLLCRVCEDLKHDFVHEFLAVFFSIVGAVSILVIIPEDESWLWPVSFFLLAWFCRYIKSIIEYFNIEGGNEDGF